MNEQIVKLIEHISEELNELEIIVKHAQEGWIRFQKESDDYYLGSVALDLHSFYNGLEKIFKLIALDIDKSLPQDSEWHKALLNQMAMEIPQLRPALISEQTNNILDEYLAFRHLIRNIYTHKIIPTKMKRLVDNLQQVFEQIQLELLAFVKFLEKQVKLL
jgi:hypothetical protein